MAEDDKMGGIAPDSDRIIVNGIVSNRTGKALLDFSWGDQRGHLTYDEANQHALYIMRESCWAFSDAALVRFLMLTSQMTREPSCLFLVEFRRHRNAELDTEAFESHRESRNTYEAWVRARQQKPQQ